MLYTSKNYDRIYIVEKGSNKIVPSGVVFKETLPDGEIHWRVGMSSVNQEDKDYQKIMKEFDLSTVRSYGEYSTKTVIGLLLEFAERKPISKSRYFPALTVVIDTLPVVNSSMLTLASILAENLNNIEYLSSHPHCTSESYVTACERNGDGDIASLVAGGIKNQGMKGDILNWKLKFLCSGLLEFENSVGFDMSLTINREEFNVLISKYEYCITYDKLLLLIHEVWEKYCERIAFTRILVPHLFAWIDRMNSCMCPGIEFLKTQWEMDAAVQTAMQQQQYTFQQQQTVNPSVNPYMQNGPQYSPYGAVYTCGPISQPGRPVQVPSGQAPYGGTNPYYRAPDSFSDISKYYEKKKASENKKDSK